MEINDKKVFVIIVTYKGRQWYDRCFSSLRASAIPLQVIVVDNASNDGSVDYIKSNYPEILLIESPKNLGFGQANNEGIRYALNHNCDYVFLLNQDAWIEPDSIKTLVEIHNNNSIFGILSPLHLCPDKSHIEKGFLTYLDDFRTTDRQLIEDLVFSRVKDVYETKYVNAAAWLIPKDTLLTVGGFDPIFFHYGEDDNYMTRVLFHGYKIGICPFASIVHDCDNPGIRTHSEQEKERRRILPLLIKFTDLYNNISISAYKRYLFRKWIVSSLRRNSGLALQYKNDYLFLKKHQSDIQASVAANSKTGKTWL